MGRELKRVLLNFQWPLHKVWKGYLCPYNSIKCIACDGSGYSVEANQYQDNWYNFQNPKYISLGNNRQYNDNAHCYHLTQAEVDELWKEDRLRDFKTKPTADQVNEWAKSGFGHDAINRHILTRFYCKNQHVNHKCKVCRGRGAKYPNRHIARMAQFWRPTEPPQGDGFQLWETTSEGSPVSPVFKTLDELCAWCETNATTFGSCRTTKEQWKKMLDENFVCHQENNKIFM